MVHLLLGRRRWLLGPLHGRKLLALRRLLGDRGALLARWGRLLLLLRRRWRRLPLLRRRRRLLRGRGRLPMVLLLLVVRSGLRATGARAGGAARWLRLQPRRSRLHCSTRRLRLHLRRLRRRLHLLLLPLLRWLLLRLLQRMLLVGHLLQGQPLGDGGPAAAAAALDQLIRQLQVGLLAGRLEQTSEESVMAVSHHWIRAQVPTTSA